ncbi:DUF2971 domain-containing protein [Rhizobium leguminosarum]|uniref:DUF2971 domain-containing protein n=1 Tax=Rhizobium leguminosarum TaxID=384 RepID=UPI001C91F1D4|nr:DUF2971 domain-containing protein [Rhizobium leguminosarum]MBY2999955.1 DUF2971 domain-containing protein [Rhizobium leguminosarum]
MPVIEHPAAPTPPGNDQIIWRFMSLEKLLSLFVTSSVYLTQVKLLRKDDPFESQFTLAHIALFNHIQSTPELLDSLVQEQIKKSGLTDPTGMAALNMASMFSPGMLEVMANVAAANTFVSCWHINDHESAALWRLYSSNEAGIAIRTTVGRLRSSLEAAPDIFMGEVKYIDFDKEIIETGNFLNPIFRKRLSFAHERELRICTMKGADRKAGEENLAEIDLLHRQPAGITVPCDLSALIEELVISPLAADWFLDTVKRVVEKFDADVKVRKSALFTSPSYLTTNVMRPPS